MHCQILTDFVWLKQVIGVVRGEGHGRVVRVDVIKVTRVALTPLRHATGARLLALPDARVPMTYV